MYSLLFQREKKKQRTKVKHNVYTKLIQIDRKKNTAYLPNWYKLVDIGRRNKYSVLKLS